MQSLSKKHAILVTETAILKVERKKGKGGKRRREKEIEKQTIH